MKKKHFYTHLVSLEIVNVELNRTGIKEAEKKHLISIIESNLHLTILDLVLSHLSKEDKVTFLKHTEAADHNKTWGFLKEKIVDVEQKIKSSTKTLIKEFLEDLKALKN